MIEVVLVRHAQPDWEPEGGAVDEPALSELGREQALALARALGPERFDAFFVSPLRRARETAHPLGLVLGQEPRVLPWLAELRLPSLAGQPSEQVERFFRDARLRDLEKHWDGMPPGESFRHFYERVSSGIEGLLVGEERFERHENSGQRIWRSSGRSRRLLFVAHAGTNAVAGSHLLGIEPVAFAPLRMALAHTGVSTLRTAEVANGVIWSLASWNSTAHLGDLPVTA